MKGQTSDGELAVLRREFSELAGLQAAGCITYTLRKHADALYIAAQKTVCPRGSAPSPVRTLRRRNFCCVSCTKMPFRPSKSTM